MCKRLLFEDFDIRLAVIGIGEGVHLGVREMAPIPSGAVSEITLFNAI